MEFNNNKAAAGKINVDGDSSKEKKSPVKISPTSSKPNIKPPVPPGSAQGSNNGDVDID